jgi:hypothetical protein
MLLAPGAGSHSYSTNDVPSGPRGHSCCWLPAWQPRKCLVPSPRRRAASSDSCQTNRLGCGGCSLQPAACRCSLPKIASEAAVERHTTRILSFQSPSPARPRRTLPKSGGKPPSSDRPPSDLACVPCVMTVLRQREPSSGRVAGTGWIMAELAEGATPPSPSWPETFGSKSPRAWNWWIRRRVA